MHKLKVMTIVGTRPEIIRLSRVIPKLDQFCEHVLVHTGQNYDYELNEVFFNELGIRKPDAEYTRKHFMIRARLYAGLINGTMSPRSLMRDQRVRMELPQKCIYCGSGIDRARLKYQPTTRYCLPCQLLLITPVKPA